jgi:hypothetical protein
MKRFIAVAALLMATSAFAGVKQNGVRANGIKHNGVPAQGTRSDKVAPATSGVRAQNAAARQGKLYIR